MNLKYLQSLADIKKRYENFFLQKKYFTENNEDSTLEEINKRLSSHYELVTEKEEDIKNEYLAICYLINLRYGFEMHRSYYTEYVLTKPSIELLKKVFNRHLLFLDKYLQCNEETYKKYDLPNVKKEYLACKHYLFQINLNAWFEKLPNEINKKNFDLEEEELLPIPNK